VALPALVALSIFPAAFLIIVNPLAVYWNFHHGPDAMPARTLVRVYHFERWLLLVRNAIIIALVYVVAARSSVSLIRLGLSWDAWHANVAIGIAVGFLRVTLQGWIYSTFPTLRDANHQPELSLGSTLFWVALFILGAFAEEFWMALCVVTLAKTFHTIAIPILVTATVFGLVHFGYRLGGMLAMAIFGTASMLLFISRGSLLPAFVFHLVGNLGVLYFVRVKSGA
jgi:membrane protease YdiL (CAAX protease family)